MDTTKVAHLRKTNCEHLEKFKQNGGLKTYAKIHANLVTCIVDKSRDLKSRLARCFVCRRTDTFIQSCLQCIYFGCLLGNHVKSHFKESGHCLVTDLTQGSIYCFKCCDFLYNNDFLAIAQANQQKLDHMLWMPWAYEFGNLPMAEFFIKWGLPKQYCILPNSTFGLRGLVNLGHTCFMNCIIQVLIHTPLLRDFFLTDKIVCNQKHDPNQQKPCIISQLYDLFQEFYNGEKTAVSLHELLHKIWGNAVHLAGYEQQDAHEFFIAMLEALHLHFAIPGRTPTDSEACKCVIDLIFLGKLRSAVTCMVCGNESITVDPFWDVSLDILGDSDPRVPIQLDECLKRYTRVEHLGSGGMIHCKKCGRNQESTKQLTFKLLPMILSLHLKRFEHSTSYKKIDNCVQFPEVLNLSSFTIGKHKSVPNKAKFHTELVDMDYRYSLYAVVNHVGGLDGGHYYAFIRHARDAWYKCDDHIITKASREEVLASPGYLLFYHKETIFYDDGNQLVKAPYALRDGTSPSSL